MATEGANEVELTAALSYDCNVGNTTCDTLSPGIECYEPASVPDYSN